MNQTQPLFSFQQKPKKVIFKTYHTKDEANALRKQLLVWLFSNRNNAFNYNDIRIKCNELKISNNIPYHLVDANILLRNQSNQFVWNTDIVNPDFSKLTNLILSSEKELRKKGKQNSSKQLVNNHQQYDLNIINQKLDLICKALGLC